MATSKSLLARTPWSDAIVGGEKMAVVPFALGLLYILFLEP
jgi:hypothetical protein